MHFLVVTKTSQIKVCHQIHIKDHLNSPVNCPRWPQRTTDVKGINTTSMIRTIIIIYIFSQ